jgi:hypothetical protein
VCAAEIGYAGNTHEQQCLPDFAGGPIDYGQNFAVRGPSAVAATY